MDYREVRVEALGCEGNEYRGCIVGLVALGAVMLGRDMGTAMVVAMGALGAVGRGPKRWFGVPAAIPTLVLLVLSNWLSRPRGAAGTSKAGRVRPEQIDHSLWARFGVA